MLLPIVFTIRVQAVVLDVYKRQIEEINRKLEALPPEHPAKYPHGLFLKAKDNLWGNIVIGLGNRLAVFQSRLADKITDVYKRQELTLHTAYLWPKEVQ